MNSRTEILFFLLFFLLVSTLQAQDAAYFKKTGEEYLAENKYEKALEAFLTFDGQQPGNGQVLTGIGMCYFHTNHLAEAKDYLYRAFKAKGNPPADTYRYLGKVHHTGLEFEKAVHFYKRYLKIISRDHPLRAVVKDDILRCATGMLVCRQAPAAAVVNLGAMVNSPGDEFKPLPSPGNEERLYFSAARTGNFGCAENAAGNECPSDIFFTEVVNGDWAPLQTLSFFINTVGQEVALGFSESGERLYFFRGKTLFSGDILVDTFRENSAERSLFSSEFISPMQAWSGDCAPFFFNDSILLFASRRSGGFGGLDLYVTTLRNGQWIPAENLGEPINTPYDETSPFLARDGRTLYFSSNNPRRSIGGLDILKSTFLDAPARWLPPVNPGVPFNSAADDDHFVLTNDGSRVFFSSARAGGAGGRDLYVGLYDEPLPEQKRRSFPVAFHLVKEHSEAAGNASESALVPEDVFENGSSVEISPMHFARPGDTLSGQNLRQLQVLAQVMKNCPQCRVLLAAHRAPGDPGGTCADVLFQALDYLQRQEAPLDNLLLLNVGEAFPVADGERYPQFNSLNRRVEVYLSNTANQPVGVRLPQVQVTEEAAVAGGGLFRKALNGLCYFAKTPLEGGTSLNELRQRFPEGMALERPSGGASWFTPGLFLTWQSAEAWRSDLEKNGFPQTTVAAMLNGWEISRKEAAQWVERYPDLKNFVEK